MLNRRLVLGMGGASLLTLALSTPSYATTIVTSTPVGNNFPVWKYEKLHLVEQAFNAARDLNFSLLDQAKMFAIDPSHVDSLSELREIVHAWVIDYRSTAMSRRIEFVIAIKNELNVFYGEANIDDQIRYIDQPQQFGNITFRQQMAAGNNDMLFRAMQYVKYRT